MDDAREFPARPDREKSPMDPASPGPAWENRNQSLRAGLGGGPALALAPPEERSSNPALDAMPPQGNGGLAPARGGLAPANDEYPAQGISGMIRGAPASGLGERALDFATSERFLVPLLRTGRDGVLGKCFLAPAVLQELGAGAKSYLEVPKTQAETSKIAEEAKVQAAEAAAKRELAPKLGVETKKLRSRAVRSPMGAERRLDGLRPDKPIFDAGANFRCQRQPLAGIRELSGRPTRSCHGRRTAEAADAPDQLRCRLNSRLSKASRRRDRGRAKLEGDGCRPQWGRDPRRAQLGFERRHQEPAGDRPARDRGSGQAREGGL